MTEFDVGVDVDDPFEPWRQMAAEWTKLQELKARNRRQPEPPLKQQPKPIAPPAPSIAPDDPSLPSDLAREEWRRSNK